MKKLLLQVTLYIFLLNASCLLAQPTITSVTSSPSGSNYNLGSSVTITINFSAAVDIALPGSKSVNLALNTGAIASATNNVTNVTSYNLTYTVGASENASPLNYVATNSLTLTGGTIKATVGGSNAILTLPGLASANALSNSNIIIDTTPPSVTSITLVSASPTNASSVDYTVTFSENVTGVDVSDFSPTKTATPGGTVSNVAGSGTTYTVTVNSITADGTIRLDLNGSGTGITDAATNPISGGFTSGSVYTIDKTLPSVTSITLVSTSPTNASSVDYTVTFSENVTGVDVSDFSLTKTATPGGTVSNVAGSGSTYTVTVNSITADGTIRLDLNGSGTGITDVATNPISGGFASGSVYTIDKTPPSVTSITLVSTSPTNASSVDYTVTFSENVTGVDVSDFSLTKTATPGGTVSNVAGSGATYTVTVNSITADGTIRLDLNGSGTGITDVATNPISGGFASGSVYTIDKTPPSVTSITLVSTSPTNASSVDYTVTFSENVTGVDVSDFSLIKTATPGGTVSNVAGSGTTYTVTVNSITADGTIRLDLNGSGTGITDAATNPISGGFTSGSVYTIDKTPPTVVSINMASASPTNATAINFTVTFSESVQATTVTASDFNIQATGPSGASFGSITPSSGNSSAFNIIVNTGSGDGTIQLNRVSGSSVTDVAGNSGTGQTFSGQSYTIDKTPPTISSIANSVATIFSGSLVQTVTVTYSETMNNAVIPIINLNGGGSNWGTQTNSGGTNGWVGNTYTATFTHNGTQETINGITTSVNVGGAQDLAGNSNTGSANSSTFNLDTQVPTVASITRANASPINALNVSFTVTFTELVQATTVAASDFTLISSGPTGTSITSITPATGNASVFTITVNTGSGDGTIELDRPSGSSVTDIAGNVGTGQTLAGQAYIIDKTPPAVSSISISSALKGVGTTNGIVASTVNFLVTFTEANVPLSGIDITDFTLSKDATISAATISSVTGSGNTRTVTVNGITGTGKLSIGLTDDDTILDPAGNPLGGTGNGNGSLAASYSGSQYYTLALAEPTNAISALTTPTITSNSITVQWNQPLAGTQAATHYLILAKPTSGGSFPTINDGSFVSDAALIQNVVNSGVSPQTTVFSSLNSGTSYDFIIYPYTLGSNNSNDNIDFKTVSPATVTAATTFSSVSTLTFNSGGGILSSITNTSPGQAVLTFTIQDDGTHIGSDVLGDNSPFKFSSIIFNVGNTNSITKWSEVIGGAQLLKGSTPITSSVVINNTNITFSSIASSSSTDPGYISDDGSQQFTLKIWLKTDLSGTQNYPSIIDGLILGFRVNNASIVYDNTSNNGQASSNLISGSTVESGSETISVVASKLAFNTPGGTPISTQPQSQIGVGVRFALSTNTQPSVYALDQNNNLDLGYSQSGTIDTPTTNLNPSITSLAFSAGVLSLSNLQFNIGGTSGIRVQAPSVTAITSTNVTAVISNKTTISAGPTVEPTTISSLITSLSGAISPQQNAVQNFDFTITDDAAANTSTYTDNDALPTLINQFTLNQGPGNDPILVDWTKIIAGAELRTSLGILVSSTVTILPTSITFSGIANTNITDPGHINDDASKTYQLKIWLQTAVDASIADDIDNKSFVFSIDQSSVSIGTTNTTSTLATSTTNSGNSNNTILVLPSKFAFTTTAYNTTSIAQSYDAPFNPLPVVKVQDQNGNRDLDYAGSPSVSTANSLLYTMANTTLVNNTGTMSFNAGFQITSAGNAPSGGTTTLTVSDGLLASATSVPITFSYSGSSDIVKQTVGFSYSTDILYAAAANQVSSITNTTGVEIERFVLRDGGSTLNDLDGTPTVLNSITLNIGNWSNLRTIALFDGNTKLIEQDVASTVVTSGANAGNISFSGFTLTANDNSSKDLSVKASFNATGVIDNQVISVSIISVNAKTTASSQFSNTNPIGIQSTLGQEENQIEVVATVIDFTTLPASASVYVPFTIIAQARDANANTDFDYNGTINSFSTTPGSPDFITTNNPTGSFALGVYTFPTNFQFTTGNNASTTLILEAGPASTPASVNAGNLSSSTSTLNTSITILTSFDSRLAVDPTYQFQPFINYINYPSPTINSTNNSYEIARFLVQDGDPSKPYAGGTQRDIDGAPTIIKDFDVELYTSASKLPIRTIAVYANGAVIAQATPSALVNGKSTTSFTGVNISTPGDEQDIAVSLLVTFLDNPNDILDNDPITLRISAATEGNGSNFVSTAGYIGGVSGGLQTPATTNAGSVPNKIAVIATRLDFTTQPTKAIVGINQPISAMAVMARDANTIVDLDYDKSNSNINYRSATITTPTNGAAVSLVNTGAPYNQFINGVITFPAITGNAPLASSLYYTSTGDGTIIVMANGLSSNDGISVGCNHVDVINTKVFGLASPTGGITASQNLKSGSQNNIIFGVTFTAPYKTVLEPNLKGFSILFDNPFVTATTATLVPSSFKIYEYAGDASSGSVSTTNIINFGAVITTGQSYYNSSSSSKDLIQVTFPNPRPLSINRSYFLSVDVAATANNSSPKLTPSILDMGYTSASDNYIVTSSGSATANIVGKQYSFASTSPPKLISSSPSTGQLNVDKNLQAITLNFDVPVVSFDGIAYLYKKSDNTLIATLKATTGIYVAPSPGTEPKATITSAATQHVTFSLPAGVTLQSDTLYYVGIPKGSFNTADNTGVGIGDDNSNFYGGISYNQTLYFKIASPNAPVLKGTNSDKYFLSSNALTINGIFDQRGTAYFMIVKKNDPAPTNAQIKGVASYSGTAYKRGGFAIIDLTPNYQSATVTVDWLVNNQQPLGDFDIWLFAENDAPTPVATTTPYSKYTDTKGATSFPQISNLPSNTSPIATYTITIPAAITGVTIKKPIVQVCSDSEIIVTEPIVITEGNLKNDFAGSGSETQSLNILLPAGLLFYDNKAPLTVSLVGADFGNVSPTINFINNTLVRINYVNTGNSSTDNIIISNLKILATLPDSTGFITKFSGNGIPSIADGTTLATIGSKQYDGQPFTNSFTLENKNSLSSLPIPITNTVTVIPDNYSTKGYIKLIPTIPAGDYGATSFSGANVTNDLLSLTSASKDNPFFITMTHTDMNGCISSSEVQYTVYDHTNAIKSLSQTQNTDGNINKITIANTNYPNQANAYPNPEKTLYNDLAGYGLVALVADTTILPAGAKQIMKDTIGSNWKRIISNVVETISTTTSGGIAFKNYRIYYDSILNAKFNGIPVDPYDNFKQTIKQTNKYQKNEYWTGGSLGTIKFTGEYLNLADGETYIARTQNLEIFLPARPLIEMGSSPSAIDSVSISGRKIAVFCEYGGDLNFTGYPKAKSGESTGKFELTDISGNKLSYQSSAFVTNSDGTATFKPTLFNNDYSEIVLNYYFQQNDAPTPPKGTAIGSLIIRIEPNPIASFIMSNSNPVVSSPITYTGCEGISVQFTSTSTISHGDITKSSFYWNFDDLNAPSAQQNSNLSKPTHIYSKTNQYNPTLYVISSLGCSSQQQPTNGLAKNTISIGVIPKVDFTFNGISTNDTFNFNNNFQVDAGAVKDGIYRLEWDFGNNKYDSSSKASKLKLTSNNHYTVANDEKKKTYIVALKATTNMGCTQTINKQLIVLPYEGLTKGNAYYDFETDQQWQALTAATGVGSDTVKSSWQRGKPNADFSLTTANMQNIWKTSLDSTYNRSEKSYLYSPSFDLSKLAKPMVSFNSNYDFYGQDGIVLQYSVDNRNIVDTNKKWFTLGIYDASNPSGYNWYNDQSLSSNPGTQTTGNYGWTKSSAGWIDSKHSLNVTQQTIEENKIKIIKPADSTNVVFRFALGSLSVRTSNIKRSGFALDNFTIGERTRLVVIESFSNLGNKSGEETPASKLLKDLNSSNFNTHDLLNINYHVAFPNQDPFNLDNIADVSSRALFYNITTSPRSRLDGFNGLKDSPNLDASGAAIDPLFSTWQNKYYLQQLKLADAKIDLTGVVSDKNGISIPVSITPLVDLDTSTTVLQVGVLEKSIPFTSLKTQMRTLIPTENQNQLYAELVLKRLLPTAAGTKLKNGLSKNITLNVGPFLWKIDSTIFYKPANDLYAFAFLQNSKTGEIYQAQLVPINNDPKVITGIETMTANDISIYPNPASNEFTIELPSASVQKINYQLFDQTGRLVSNGFISEGQVSKTINTLDFANGLYIIQLGSESNITLRKKVMVAHGD